MTARIQAGSKGLKRQLASIKAEEQRASTWLIRISLFLLVLGWAYSEYASDKQLGAPRGRRNGAGRGKKQGGTAVDLKPFLLAAGAVLGAIRLLLRFYFMRRTKVIEESLLSDEDARPATERRRKKPSRQSTS
ncbi:hypothetical protein JCM10908_000540 [Rhodotorula pacifica]|uniref:uncharacterized protein n=1 Tax=Rhodotorula pacifica TaxID=1495444 RepID=UPI0031761195